MGMRGPQPKPNPNESAIKAVKGSMAPPPWVLAEAIDHWDTIVETLREMGIESPVYNPALALLVNTMGRYIAAEKALSENGAVTYSQAGTSATSGHMRNRNALSNELKALLREFGLTPIALSSIRKSKPTKEETEKQEKGILGLISPKLVG